MKSTKSWVIASFLSLSAGLMSCTQTTTLKLATVGDTMAYDQTSLDAKAGSTVTLTLKNNATSPAMQHNFVLTQPGAENEVGLAGISAEAKGYIPDSPKIIAHTKLLKPGESDTITFKAPDQAGDYPYICTFPGHYAVMKGVLHVK